MFRSLISTIRLFVSDRADLMGEVFALRQQVAVLERRRPRRRIQRLDRLFWMLLSRVWSG